MKKITTIILTVILNLTIFALFGFAQDTYFEQQIKNTKPPVKSVQTATTAINGGGAPSNDNFENAETVVLTNNSVTLLRSNVDATKEQNEPDHAENEGGKSVWFTFTPTATQNVRIQTTHTLTNFDTTLAVYSGSTFTSGFSRVGYNDDCCAAGCGTTSMVDLKLEAGTAYRIAVDGYKSGAAEPDAGVFVLTLTASDAPVSYDNIGAAYDLGTALAGSIAGTNYPATAQANEPGAYANLGGKSVWYRFQTSNLRAMTFEIRADFTEEIAVYYSSVANPTFAQLVKLDDNRSGFSYNYGKYEVNFSASPSLYYFIQIDYNDADQTQIPAGNFQLKFYQTKLRYSSRLNNYAPITSLSLFRPADQVWYSLAAYGLLVGRYEKFGLPSDTPVPADYNGDGLTNYAVTRNLNGLKHWYILWQNSASSYSYKQWGLATDKAVTGDFDRDGLADPTVIRRTNGQLVWYINRSSNGQMRTFVYGLADDRPVIGDFDGDGATDVAVVRAEGGNLVWWILGSNNLSYAQSSTYQFGLAGDLPVAEDFDGDGKTDVAVFRPSNGTWYIRRSKTGELQTTPFGVAGDYPQPGDYDGDGKADLAVFRAETGDWYLRNSYLNTQEIIHWGLPGDITVSSMARFSLPESNE
jgi:hypothetical protein